MRHKDISDTDWHICALGSVSHDLQLWDVVLPSGHQSVALLHNSKHTQIANWAENCPQTPMKWYPKTHKEESLKKKRKTKVKKASVRVCEFKITAFAHLSTCHMLTPTYSKWRDDFTLEQLLSTPKTCKIRSPTSYRDGSRSDCRQASVCGFHLRDFCSYCMFRKLVLKAVPTKAFNYKRALWNQLFQFTFYSSSYSFNCFYFSGFQFKGLINFF